MTTASRRVLPPGMDAALARLTVVVPVGPGDRVSPALRAQLAALPREAEVHLVHADVPDAPRVRAAHAAKSGPRVTCMRAVPGRAAQQNAGAAAGRRDWVWFLHADSQLAPATLPAMAAFVQRDEAALGYFDLRFLDDGPALMRLNALGAWVRSHWFGLPFGDQGLALPRAVFDRLGGFNPALEHGEDHDLVWRARRAGVPLAAIGAPLLTSARKYVEHGWWSTTCWHLRETGRQARRFSQGDPGR
jgi:hypothetical protein